MVRAGRPRVAEGSPMRCRPSPRLLPANLRWTNFAAQPRRGSGRLRALSGARLGSSLSPSRLCCIRPACRSPGSRALPASALTSAAAFPGLARRCSRAVPLSRWLRAPIPELDRSAASFWKNIAQPPPIDLQPWCLGKFDSAVPRPVHPNCEGMIVHLIDGTYELFRHFYGHRRYNQGKDKPYQAVAGVLHSILEMVETGA